MNLPLLILLPLTTTIPRYLSHLNSKCDFHYTCVECIILIDFGTRSCMIGFSNLVHCKPPILSQVKYLTLNDNA
jgi:hypothetical protein